MLKKILNKHIIEISEIDENRVFLITARGGKCFEYNVNTKEIIYETMPIKNAAQIMHSEDEKTLFVSNTSGKIFLISKDENEIIKNASYQYEPFNNNLFCIFDAFYYADKKGKLNRISAEDENGLNIPDFPIANITKCFDKLFIVEGKKYDRLNHLLLCGINENNIVVKEKIMFPPNYYFDSLMLSFCKNKVIVAIYAEINNAIEIKWILIDAKTNDVEELGLKYTYKGFEKLFNVQNVALKEWRFDFNRNLALFLALDSIFLVDLTTNKKICEKKLNASCHQMHWITENRVLIATSEGLYFWDFDVDNPDE